MNVHTLLAAFTAHVLSIPVSFRTQLRNPVTIEEFLANHPGGVPSKLDQHDSLTLMIAAVEVDERNNADPGDTLLSAMEVVASDQEHTDLAREAVSQDGMDTLMAAVDTVTERQAALAGELVDSMDPIDQEGVDLLTDQEGVDIQEGGPGTPEVSDDDDLGPPF